MSKKIINNKTVTLNSVIRRNEDLISSRIDDEFVMMSFKNNEYYGLNKVGSRIWQLIEEPTPVNVLIQALTKEFDVDIAQCRDDVMEYIKKLHSKKLITIL